MANWHISKISTLTHEVEMKSDKGGFISAIVPEEHRELVKHKAYLKGLIDAYIEPVEQEIELEEIELKTKAINFLKKYAQPALILALLAYILKLKLGY